MGEITKVDFGQQPEKTVQSNPQSSNSPAPISVWKTFLYQNNSKIKLNYFNVNGELLRTDEIKKHPNQGAMLLTSQTTTDYINHKEYNIKEFRENGYINNSFKTIKGEQVDQTFNADLKSGNSNYILKIADEKGNVLFDINREYINLNKTEAISKLNGKEYKIKTMDEKIVVSCDDKQTIIDLRRLIPGEDSFETDRVKIKKMVKQLPGDILLQLNREANGIKYIENDGFFFPSNDVLATDNLYTSLLHELGHAIDTRPNNAGKNLSKLAEDKNLQKIFNKERDYFKKIVPQEIVALGKVFNINSTSEDAFKDGLEEIVADSYFIINSGCNYKSICDKENDIKTNPRQHFLLQYFPKTIAYIGNKMVEQKQIIDYSNPRTIKEQEIAIKKFGLFSTPSK